jgi:hypothetical protein
MSKFKLAALSNFWKLFEKKAKESYGEEFEWFAHPVDKTVYPEYYEIIKSPMYYDKIKSALNKGGRYDCFYGGDIDLFFKDFKQIAVNARTYNTPDTEAFHAAGRLEELFYSLLSPDWKQMYGQTSANSSSKPSSSSNNNISSSSNNSSTIPERKIAAGSIERKAPAASPVVSNNSATSNNERKQAAAAPATAIISDRADTTKLRHLLDKLRKLDKNSTFEDDPRALELYSDYVKHPMWLKKVSEKIAQSKYATNKEFYDDVMLIWGNCCDYNGVTSDYSKIAKEYENKFKEFYKQSFPNFKPETKPNLSANSSGGVGGGGHHNKHPAPAPAPAHASNSNKSPSAAQAPKIPKVSSNISPAHISGGTATVVAKSPALGATTTARATAPATMPATAPPTASATAPATATATAPATATATATATAPATASATATAIAVKQSPKFAPNASPAPAALLNPSGAASMAITPPRIEKNNNSTSNNALQSPAKPDIAVSIATQPSTEIASKKPSPNLTVNAALPVTENSAIAQQLAQDNNNSSRSANSAAEAMQVDDLPQLEPAALSTTVASATAQNSSKSSIFSSPTHKSTAGTPEFASPAPRAVSSLPSSASSPSHANFSSLNVAALPQANIIPLNLSDVEPYVLQRLDEPMSERIDGAGLLNLVNFLIESDGKEPKEQWFTRATELLVGSSNWIRMHEVLPKIIDLSTVKKQLKEGKYGSYRALFEDLEQIWANCDLFWAQTHPEYCLRAAELRKVERQQFAAHLRTTEAEKAAELSRLHGFELEKAKGLLEQLQKNEFFGKSFTTPITEAFAEGFADYKAQIARPIDLTAIKTKLEAGNYISLEEFFTDCALVYENCIEFWTRESEYAIGAIVMLNELQLRVKEINFELTMRGSKLKGGAKAKAKAARNIPQLTRQLSTSTFLPPTTPMTPFYPPNTGNLANSANSTSLFDFPETLDSSALLPQPSLMRDSSILSMISAAGSASVGPQLSDEEFDKCDAVLGQFKGKGTGKYQKFNVFNDPIIPTMYGSEILDYFAHVQQPMDFGTMLRKLYINEYSSVEQFLADARLIWENCISYYSNYSSYDSATRAGLLNTAKELSAEFLQLWDNYKPRDKQLEEKAKVKKEKAEKAAEKAAERAAEKATQKAAATQFLPPRVKTDQIPASPVPSTPSVAMTPSGVIKFKLPVAQASAPSIEPANSMGPPPPKVKRERENETAEEKAARKAKKKDKKEHKRREEEVDVDIAGSAAQNSQFKVSSGNSLIVPGVKLKLKQNDNPLSQLAQLAQSQPILIRDLALSSKDIRHLVRKTLREQPSEQQRAEASQEEKSEASPDNSAAVAAATGTISSSSVADVASTEIVKMEDDASLLNSTGTNHWASITLDQNSARTTTRIKQPILFKAKSAASKRSVALLPISLDSFAAPVTFEVVSSTEIPAEEAKAGPAQPDVVSLPAVYTSIVANAPFLRPARLLESIFSENSWGNSAAAYEKQQFYPEPSGKLLIRPLHHSILPASVAFPYHLDHFIVSVAVNPSLPRHFGPFPLEFSCFISNFVGLGVNLTSKQLSHLTAVTARIETGLHEPTLRAAGEESFTEKRLKQDLANLDTVLLAYPKPGPDFNVLPPISAADWDNLAQLQRLLRESKSSELEQNFKGIEPSKLQWNNAGFYHYSTGNCGFFETAPCISFHFLALCGTLQLNINSSVYFSSPYHSPDLLVHLEQYYTAEQRLQRQLLVAEEETKRDRVAAVAKFLQGMNKLLEEETDRKSENNRDTEGSNEESEGNSDKKLLKAPPAAVKTNLDSSNTSVPADTPRSSRSSKRRLSTDSSPTAAASTPNTRQRRK